MAAAYDDLYNDDYNSYNSAAAAADDNDNDDDDDDDDDNVHFYCAYFQPLNSKST